MAFREVTMLEAKEILRLWLLGRPLRAVAKQVGVDRNTVRRYVRAAVGLGLSPGEGLSLSDSQLGAVLERLRERESRERGESWVLCEARRSFIEDKLGAGLRLTKVHRLLHRHGVDIPYATLHRFAALELDFGRRVATIPVADCGPGEELQLDTGWMGYLERDVTGRRRRFRAWIFTSVLSRHRFVYPTFHESTESAIEACEAAWRFFGGVFRVVIPDNTKAIVQQADPTGGLLNEGFLEYAQARGFEIDPTRVRSPKDKARVERSVPTVREDCFAGEKLQTLAQARERAEIWSRSEYGQRRHTSTGRMPLEYFEAVERDKLIAAPSEPYDIPKWSSPKVGPDQHGQVLRALYSLPRSWRGKKVRARADSTTVRLYYKGELLKVYPRQPPGGRYTDPADFPPEQYATAQRDLDFWRRRAREHGDEIGRYADALLAGNQPWTKVRRVFALLSMCKRFGDERVNATCKTALDAELIDVKRLRRMLLQASNESVPKAAGARVVPIARYLRPATQYALAFTSKGPTTPNQGDEP